MRVRAKRQAEEQHRAAFFRIGRQPLPEGG